MSAITTLNPKAESARQAQALAINISAARGLAEMLKTNLGPKGTMKMYVSANKRRNARRDILGWSPVLATSKSPRMATRCCTKWFVATLDVSIEPSRRV